MKKLFYLFVALMISQSLFAVTKTWYGTNNTNWADAGNWSPAGIPATGDNIIINNVSNDPIIQNGTTVNVINISLSTGASLTVNSGGTLNVSQFTVTGIYLDAATLTNNGTINLTSNGDNVSEITLLSGSTVINSGTITLNSGYGITNSSGATFTNNACGKVILADASNNDFRNSGTVTNDGLIQIFWWLHNSGSITNNGVLKYETLNTTGGGTITNNRIIIDDNILIDEPGSSIFQLGASNNATVDGIFTNSSASSSAGNYNQAMNIFTPGPLLPGGLRTLYAKITLSGGSCILVVPFLYTNTIPLPVIVADPVPKTACPGSGTSFSITATGAQSYQWQLSTNGGSSWANVPNSAPYSNVTSATLNISSATGLNNNQYRCNAINLGGSVTSNAATLTVSGPVSTLTGLITWNGSVSTDWNTACNWSPASVPGTGNSVVIPDTPNEPAIGSNVTVLYVDIQTNAQLTVNNGASLTTTAGFDYGINLENGSIFTNNGTTTIQESSNATGFFIVNATAIINNNGTLTVGADEAAFASYTAGSMTVNNAANATITVNGNATGFDAYFSGTLQLINHGSIIYNGPYGIFSGVKGSIVNNGLIHATSGTGALLFQPLTITNALCAKFIIGAGNLYADASDIITNNGYLYVAGEFVSVRNFTNNGVLKYGSVIETFTNTAASAVIVNDAVPIFTYGVSGSSYTGTVEGIFTDLAANASAGTYTQATNTFTPLGTLPAGSQTLYARITPSGGGCTYVVPFTYTNNIPLPVITADPVSKAVCAGLSTSFSITATGAASYRWQLSTDGGGAWANVPNSAPYSNVTTTTLNISDVTGLNNNQYRCVATNGGGSVESTAATLTVNTPTPTPTGTITWLGSVSTDWNTACNWSPTSVPGSENKVVIPDTPNDPIIGTSVTVLEVTLQTNAQLTVSNGASLTVTSAPFYGFIFESGSTFTNNGTVQASSATMNVAFYANSATNVTINNNGAISARAIQAGFGASGSYMTINNAANATITLSENGGVGFSTFYSDTETLQLINNGTIAYNGMGYIFLGLKGSVVNNGLIQAAGAGFAHERTTSFTNNACGKVILTTGDYITYPDASASTTINNGYFYVGGQLGGSGSFTNNGVLKYGTLSQTITNTDASAVIVNNAVPIFTYGVSGSSYTGTIDGIFIDDNAGTSAGTYTKATNTFTPLGTLPAGSQTLYAKITPSGGGCFYVVPFTYNNGCGQIATATETMTWNGSVSTDWNNPCNWTPNGVPSGRNNVIINNADNAPVINSGVTARALILYINDETLTVNAGGILNTSSSAQPSYIVLQQEGATLVNDGTISAGYTASGYGIVATASGTTLTNRGIINTYNSNGINGSTASITITNNGTINHWGNNTFLTLGPNSSLDNFGTINANSGSGIVVGGGTVTNQACAKIILTTGDYNYQTAGSRTTNFGLLQIGGSLYGFRAFSNRGVVRHDNAGSFSYSPVDYISLIIRDTPGAIFVFSGGSYNGTIDGIFKNASATFSAGSYDQSSNTFTPSGLPSGIQTLYAKITPNGGACSYTVPFIYNNVPDPIITANGTLTAFSTCNGTASASQSFTVSGTNLTDLLLILPPTGFQLSTTLNGTYGNSIGLSPNNLGTVSTTTIYVRLASTAFSTISGDLTCGTIGINKNVVVSVPLTGTATPLPALSLGSVFNANTCGGTGSISFTSNNLPNGTYPLSFIAAGTGASTSPQNITVTDNAFTINLNAGSYRNFSVTANGCAGGTSPSITERTVSNPPSPTLTAGTSVDPTTCGGTGSIAFTTTNLPDNIYTLHYKKGTTAQTASITVSANGFLLSGLTQGLYSDFSITNVGCTGSDNTTKTLTDPTAPITPTGSVTVEPTCTTPTGTIIVTAPTGTDIQYSVNGTDYQTETTFSGLAPNTTYSVTAKNTTTGCVSLPLSLTINALPGNPATPTAGVTAQPNCTTPTGTIVITAPTGSDIQYSLNGTDYQPLATFSGLNPNTTYSVTAKNTTTGCVSDALSLVVNAVPNAPAIPTASVTVQPTCTTPTGTIEVTAPTGGTIQYSIDGTNYQASATFSGLAPNTTYFVTAKNTATGCISDALSLTVNTVPNAPAVPTASVTAQPTCITPTGTIVVTAPTGADIQYSVGGAYQVSGTFSALAPNTTYLVTAKNTTTGCVSDALSLVVNALPNAPAIPTASVTAQPTCTTPTGTIVVTAPTGTDIQYSIDGTNYQASATFSGLAPNPYSVTAKNTATGCISDALSLAVNAVPSNPATPTASVTAQPTCTTLTGTIVVTAPTGGNIQYSIGGAYLNSGTFSGLTPGTTYLVTAKNTTTGCISQALSLIVNAIPGNPATPTASVTAQPTCTTSTGTIVVTTPTGTDIQYSVDGTNYQASASFSGLAPNPYLVTAKNTATGCISDALSLTVNTVPNASATPTASVTVQPTCTTPTGTIVVTAPTGGTIQYSVDGTNYQASATFSGLIPNTSYSVTAKNTTTGCVSDALSLTVNTVPNAPAIPTASVTVQPTCTTPTGTIVVTAPTGGTIQYSINGTNYQASGTFSGLAPNPYSVTAKNTATGCISDALSLTVNTVPNAPATPTASVTAQPTCTTLTGTIEVTAPTGGTIQYSIDGMNYQVSASFSGLTPGTTYSVTAKNTTTGCVSSPLSLTVNVAPTTTDIAVSFSGPNPVCQGSPSALLPNTGGTWISNDLTKASVTADGQITALQAGTVTFTFTTLQGCTAVSPALTIKPTPFSALTASQTEVCPNTQVTLDAQCSIPTATVNWRPGAPTVIPDAANIAYVYRARCESEGCIGNESSVEVRTHRILVDMKDLDVGTLPLPIARAVKDNLAPTNVINAPVFPRRWTFIAMGCNASESAVFMLSGPVSFRTVDNEGMYAMFGNDAGGFYSLDHPNYGNGGSFPNGTYTLTVDLRSSDGVGGPFPKNRVAAGSLLATRSLQFTVQNPVARMGMSPEPFAAGIEGMVQVIPNPVVNTMRLHVSDSRGESVNIELLDTRGRNLLQGRFVALTDQHQEEFDLSHLSNGLYFLRVKTGNKQTVLKVIKVQ